MLRKELKEAAQRVLKGNYGNWAPFAVWPLVVIFISSFVGLIALSAREHQFSIDYDDSYYYQGEPDDGYYGDYLDQYTPAYNYGYALGTQSGYLKGWQDGMQDVGDGHSEEDEQDILDSIKEKPKEFLSSTEFEQGVMDAYSYNYSEGWSDSQEYQKGISNLSGVTATEKLVPLKAINTNGFDELPELPESHYYPSAQPSWFFRTFAFLFAVVILILIVIFQVFYKPLLEWAAIDTVDGEKIHFITNQKAVLSRLEVVASTNLKILFFTFMWSLLLFIPGVIKHCAYAMSNYLLKREPDLDSTQAIALSQELMKGYKIEYLIFRCSFFLWYLAQAYSLGFASFYVTPYYETAQALFFDEIYYEKRPMPSNI